ncbi:DNA ligase 1 [Blattella germanica]|nr:DNA ligase 1 [Blattella germanica]
MSQKHITSFFSVAPGVSNARKSPLKDACKQNNSDVKGCDSPIKATSSARKKRLRIESDSEDETTQISSPSPKKKSVTDSPSTKKQIKSEENGVASNRDPSSSPESKRVKQNGTSSPDKTNVKGIKKNGSKKDVTKVSKQASRRKTAEKSMVSGFLKTNETTTKIESIKVEDDNEKKEEESSKIKPAELQENGEVHNKSIAENTSSEQKNECSLVNNQPVDQDAGEEKSPITVKEEKNEGNTKLSPKKESPPKKQIHSFFAPRKSHTDDTNSKTSQSTKNESSSSKSGGSKISLKHDGSRDIGADYDPTKSKYDPIENAFWKRGDKVPYLALAKTLEEIEAVSARLKMIEILANYFRSVIVLSPDDLLPSVYLCLNKLAPAYEGIELGIAETTLMKAIAQSTGRTVAQIKSDANSTGDLGLVAEHSRSNQRMMFQPAKLTVQSVFSKLKEIAQMSGQAAMSKKADKIQSMFVACRYSEARFLIRSLAGKLRIGLAEQSVLQALALACALTPPNQSYPPEVLNANKGMSQDSFKARVEEESLVLKTTYCECPNYNKIIPVLLEKGIKSLPEHCRLTPGIPLKPMLAHPTKGVQEVLQRFDNLKFTCEWKYDGERAQIHLAEDGTINIYSRNQENNTSKYPDIIGRLSKALGEGVKSCILDCEAVAWDKEKQQILPFQVLSTRKRKASLVDCLNKVNTCQNHMSSIRSFVFNFVIFWPKQLHWFLVMLTFTRNCEGLMVKTLEEEATYEIAKRSRNWLKLKKDYLEGVGDTLDVVVLGGYLGRGKRAGMYGGFLLACYDNENEEYQSLCKIGTGFSDEDLNKHTEFFKEHLIEKPKPYYRYDSSHEPDHWFETVQVWEIKCADLSLSPVHRAAIGIVDPEKGISLRFPRFLRIRDDKTVEEATTASQVAEMYGSQEQIINQQGGNKVAEEDFY